MASFRYTGARSLSLTERLDISGLTELREYVETIHCSLVSSMLRSSPMVGSEMKTAVAFAVYDPHRRSRSR